jgi:selenocysteine lyase/cysteine desulfurase
MGAFAASVSLGGLSDQLIAQSATQSIQQLRQLELEDAIQNEELWKYVQQAYTTSSNFINLNNGGVSPQPKTVQDAEMRYLKMSNEGPSYYMWRLLNSDVEIIRTKLAKLGDCSKEEISLNQNTTEGIQTVIMGMDWKKGDEIVVTKQDYSTVKIGWEYLEQRYGVKIIWLDLEVPFEDDKAYLEAFLGAFTEKTKLVNLTHIINWNGQQVPVKTIRKICDEARKRGVFSLVDGAHSFAQLDFKIRDLGCDAYATSLHKWLCAPFGTGMLYVRKEMIPKLWSLMPSSADQQGDIRKFEHQGTRSFARISAIGQAIDFHNMIGIQLKEKRLRYLQEYWTKALKNEEGLSIHHPQKKNYSSALGLFQIEGLTALEISQKLLNKYRIHTVAIEVENIVGVRISPNVYTKISDLDYLTEAVRAIIKTK